MGVIITFHKRVHIQMGVALCRSDFAMPQKLLHGTQIRSAFKQVRGKRMPQIMNGNMRRNTRFFTVIFNNSVGFPAVKALSPLAYEKGFFRMLRSKSSSFFKPDPQGLAARV